MNGKPLPTIEHGFVAQSFRVCKQGPWRGLDDVEFATLTYVDWFNHRRLHGEIEPGPGFITPTAFETATTVNPSPPTRPGLNNPSLHQTRGASRQPMSKLIYTAMTSLDGYVEDDDDRFDWVEPDVEVSSCPNGSAPDLGRVTPSTGLRAERRT